MLTKRLMPFALLIGIVIALAGPSQLVLAQSETDRASASPSPAAITLAQARPADREQTFAGAFFISRRTDHTGEQSIEWIGSIIIWFLLTLSVFSIGLIGMLAATNQRKSIVPQGVIDEVRNRLLGGKFRETLELTRHDESHFSQIMHAALREANHGFSAVIRALEQTGDELTTRRMRRVEFLNILGQVSPMIGLFGTVYGMILAFQAIVAAGGDPDPVQLAGGIGTALTTTFWGLVVAIPALAGYAVIRNRIDELTTEASLAAEEVLNQFRTKASASSRSSQAQH
jgi:biopolymer transport protein ExbB